MGESMKVSLTPYEVRVAAFVERASVPAEETPDWLDKAFAHDAARHISALLTAMPEDDVWRLVDAMRDSICDGKPDDETIRAMLAAAAGGDR